MKTFFPRIKKYEIRKLLHCVYAILIYSFQKLVAKVLIRNWDVKDIVQPKKRGV
jgi:hypothetical protein